MRTKDEVYWIERDQIAIAKESSTGEFTSPQEVKTVTIYGSRYEEVFNELSVDSPSELIMPEQFQEAIAYKVLEDIYASNPQTVQLASYWGGRYAQKVIEAKKYVNINRDGSAPQIVPHDF
jgi:hypothetical protein